MYFCPEKTKKQKQKNKNMLCRSWSLFNMCITKKTIYLAIIMMTVCIKIISMMTIAQTLLWDGQLKHKHNTYMLIHFLENQNHQQLMPPTFSYSFLQQDSIIHIAMIQVVLHVINKCTGNTYEYSETNEFLVDILYNQSNQITNINIFPFIMIFTQGILIK